MKSAEQILYEWEREYELLEEDRIYNFYDQDISLLEFRTKTGTPPYPRKKYGIQSKFQSFWDPEDFKTINYLGKKCNLHICINGRKGRIKPPEIKKLDPVGANLTRKALYRYLLSEYSQRDASPD